MGGKDGCAQQQLKTQRMDPRYPFTNQTKACYDNYCDFYKCKRLLGDVPDCTIFKKYFESICPNEWIEHWDELRQQELACYDNYCDYFKCKRLLGDVDDCKIFKQYFESICPASWIEHWDELREKSAFPGAI